jgi:hypothetical protein
MTQLPVQRADPKVEPICHRSAVVVRLEGGQTLRAHAELVGGRQRWSVGGMWAEGPRWWHGELACEGDPPARLDAGAAIRLELSDGRAAIATIEESAGDLVRVAGCGAPPFDVP